MRYRTFALNVGLALSIGSAQAIAGQVAAISDVTAPVNPAASFGASVLSATPGNTLGSRQNLTLSLSAASLGTTPLAPHIQPSPELRFQSLAAHETVIAQPVAIALPTALQVQAAPQHIQAQAALGANSADPADAHGLPAGSAGDSLSTLTNSRSEFGGHIGAMAENLNRVYDNAGNAGEMDDPVPHRSDVHEEEIANLTKKSPDAVLSRENDGWLVQVHSPDGRPKTFKVFSQDGVVTERAQIPPELRSIYEALPGGGIRHNVSADPLIAGLRQSKTELWGIRHGEALANVKGLTNGSGTDTGLTDTPNAKGTHGRMQAEAAAKEFYDRLGGDNWVHNVLSGKSAPLVILQSPLLRARQTADALKRLLDQKRTGWATKRSLYEEEVTPELREIGYGRLDGQPLDTARQFALWQGFDCYQGRGKDFLDKFPASDLPGKPAESRFDVMLRQRKLFERILHKYSGRKVVLFSHFETVVAQQAILGLLQTDPSDGALLARPIENAKPIPLLVSPQ